MPVLGICKCCKKSVSNEAVFCPHCGQPKPFDATIIEMETFTDPRDGKVYKTIKIGDQVWMAENLNYDSGEGCWCYDNDESNAVKYGRLYDWKTAKQVTPPGWHLPSKSDFEKLLQYLDCIGYQYKQITNCSGFNVMFGGYRNNDGNFSNIGSSSNFWSSSVGGDNNAWSLHVSGYNQKASMFNYSGDQAFSVRLIKD